MKIMDRLSRFFGRGSEAKAEHQSELLDPFEIRRILEGRLERLYEFASSPRLHATDPKGDTPLHLAARSGNLPLCDLFVLSGADPAVLNFERQTPADLALSEGHTLVAQLLSSLLGSLVPHAINAASEAISDAEGSSDEADVVQTHPQSEVEQSRTNSAPLPENLNAGTSWTAERIEILKQMWAEGRSASEIAQELGGVSRNAVIGKAHRLGLWEKKRVGAESSESQSSDVRPAVAPAPIEVIAHGSITSHAEPTRAEDELDDLDGLLDFDAGPEPEEFFDRSAKDLATGTFVAITSSAPSSSDYEGKDWDLDLSSVQIVGDGIGSSKKIDADHRTEHDYLKVGNRGRQSVKRAVVQTGTRLCIDPQICATWAEETLTDGWRSFDDIDTLVAFCEGNGDPFDLRTNIERILEVAGIDIFSPSSCYDAGVWDVRSEICAVDLAEAIEAALTRSVRLPGTQLFVMDKSDELQLLEPMIRAKQELQLAILASETAVEKILNVFASIRDGGRDPSSVTLRMIIPARPDHTETAEVFSAVEALNSWWGNGRVMDGKRRREALAALEALDFSLPFYKELVRSVEEADASGELTSRLDTQICAFEGSTDALIHVHLPYARRFAARNVEQGEDPEDVFQVAFMGLQRSTRRFDPERGARFVTYCTFWMKQALTRWRADEGSAIRVPVHRHGYLIKLDQAIDMLDVRADGSVSDRDLASELGWTPDEVRQFRQIPRQTEYPDETDAWDEVLPISDEENFFEQEETRKIISDALDELPERQADVIRKRFGIGQDQEMTLEEIGQLYGVTRERIRQIEAKGLNQLSHPGRKRRLQTLLGM